LGGRKIVVAGSSLDSSSTWACLSVIKKNLDGRKRDGKKDGVTENEKKRGKERKEKEKEKEKERERKRKRKGKGKGKGNIERRLTY
jgi:hypothetical protein